MWEDSNFPFVILIGLLHDFIFYIAEERMPDETEGDKKDGDEQEVQIDTFRVIGIRRSPGECLVSPFFLLRTLKFFFSEKTTKICGIFLMILAFAKGQ